MSFLDYYLQRTDGLQFKEMSADPALFGGEQIEEKRKTPIFLDQEDIDYLYQFPPALWKQALAYRYGPLLKMAYESNDRGRKIPDVHNVTLNYRRGRQKAQPIIFPRINTQINSLYHKLTATVDDNMYSKLTREQKQQYIDHATKNKLGSLGYVLRGFKQGKDMSASHGFIGLDPKVARTRLASLYKANQEGWLGEVPPTAVKKKMTMGGGGKTDMWVHSYDDLKTLPGQGKLFGRTKDGKRVWYGYDKNTHEQIPITDHLPVLRPAAMVNTRAYKDYNGKMMLNQQIAKDLSKGDVQKYINAMNPVVVVDYQRRIEQLRSWLESNKKPVRGSDVNSQKRTQYKNELNDLLGTLRVVDKVKRYAEHDKISEQQLHQPQVFHEYLRKLSGDLVTKAKEIQQTTDKYDVHDWNIHHFNPGLPNAHTSWTGFGTINPNWQQPETVHGGLLRLGIKPEDFWSDVKQYLVQAGTDTSDDGEVPVVKDFFDSSKLAQSGDLARGMNQYLSAGRVYGSPAWYAITKNWWSVFENAANYLRNKLGSKNFLPYARLYDKHKKNKANEDDLKQALNFMKKGAFQAGFNYAGMVFQLKNRMGGGTSPGGVDLDSLITGSKQLQMASQQIATNWNRRLRPEDPNFAGHQDHGRTSHAIPLLHQMLDEELDREVTQAVKSDAGTVATAVHQLGPQADEQEKKMTQDIVATGLAFVVYRHIYIYTKNQDGQKWTLADANEFASRATDVWMQKHGMRKFGGQIKVSSKKGNAYAVAQRNVDDEAKLKQMQNLGYQGKQPGVTAPKSGTDHHKQAEQLMVMAKMADNKKILEQLQKNSPTYNDSLRKYFDKWVADKNLGWPIISQILNRVDKT